MATAKSKNGANLGFEEKLWQAADKLRGHMDAAEYKHVVLGLIFRKYISDAFQEWYEALKADPEDRDEYTVENVLWVPKAARWSHLQSNANRRRQTLFIDARKMGYLVDRTHRELSEEEDRPHLPRLARGERSREVRGRARLPQERRDRGNRGPRVHPDAGSLVGAEAVEDEDEPFEEKRKRLVAKREEQFAESNKLEEQIRANLKGLGYGS